MSYSIIRSARRRKTLSIQVKGDRTVIVRVPLRASRDEIDRFLKEKNQWLQRQISRQQERNNERPCRAFVPGERFPYLGEAYILKLNERDNAGDALTFTGREFLLRRDAFKGVRVLFHLWYQKQARMHFEKRASHFSALLGLSPQGVDVGNAGNRWGSCSPDNRLKFSWRLIMAPPEIVDYVAVHELCHIRVRNHSRDYWRLVEDIVPDHKKHRAWLKDHGHLLTI